MTLPKLVEEEMQLLVKTSLTTTVNNAIALELM
jgi:hypothetical protein